MLKALDNDILESKRIEAEDEKEEEDNTEEAITEGFGDLFTIKKVSLVVPGICPKVRI